MRWNSNPQSSRLRRLCRAQTAAAGSDADAGRRSAESGETPAKRRTLSRWIALDRAGSRWIALDCAGSRWIALAVERQGYYTCDVLRLVCELLKRAAGPGGRFDEEVCSRWIGFPA